MNIMCSLVGNPAPAFTAEVDVSGEDKSSPRRLFSVPTASDRWLVLFWYPHDFSTICPTELLALSDSVEEFAVLDTDIIAASTDSVYVHRARLEVPRDDDDLLGLRYPLISDPTGAIARLWGVYQESVGCASRMYFIVDPVGSVQYAYTHSMSTGRSVEEILRV